MKQSEKVAEKLNVDAVEYIIKACEHTGAYLLHLSTDFIFDGEAGPYDENGIPNPVSFMVRVNWLLKNYFSIPISNMVLPEQYWFTGLPMT